MLKPLFAATIAACLVPQIAQAKPVMLSCAIQVDGKPVRFNVSPDADTQQVTFEVVASGFIRKYNGSFTSNEVGFGDGDVRFSVNRTNLAFSRTILALDSVDRGQCHKMVAHKTAI